MSAPGRPLRRLAGLATRPLPVPPDALRRGPFRKGRFSSSLHTQRLAAQLGLWLGISFGICFLTGLFSHFLQHQPHWATALPTRPVSFYRMTQGLHVATGLASIPLLLAKLWTVYPRLWEWPPARNLAHAVERGSLFLLVGGATFQLITGLMNVAGWYAFKFFFTPAHYWTAYITIGALLIHIGAKLATARAALSRGAGRRMPDPPRAPGSLSRRGFLTTVGAAAGVVTLATVGETVGPLSGWSPFAPRRASVGPQHLPVNKSARSARIRDAALDPGYRLQVVGARTLSLSLDDLNALPQHNATLPITCVEGWSAVGQWGGVRLRDLLDQAGVEPDRWLRMESLERAGLYRTAEVSPGYARDPLTLIALRLGGAPLALDHGYPCRLIAPDRPGVLQTKWLHRIVAL